MSRLKQNQNIDGLIQSINTIAENRCSLSDEDVRILNESLIILKNLKKKKGKTNENVLTLVVTVVDLLSCFFKKDSQEMKENH
jgi:hypothetical protein